ncbi:MAG: deoxyribodipyrimidine photo-lyase [Candidatus Azotimanducaceae bacterium]|jgi:deoxyribodipyrimidine photo-lyase
MTTATSLFIFRRDLRVQDNTGLNEALKSGQAVVPLFIVDPGLLQRWQSADKRLSFLFRSLAALSDDLERCGGRLLVRVGEPSEVVRAILEEHSVTRVFVNREYTPLGIRRDERIEKACAELESRFHIIDDAVLNPPEWVKKGDGGPYTVFTPYYRRASQLPVAEPAALSDGLWAKLERTPLGGIDEIAPYLPVESLLDEDFAGESHAPLAGSAGAAKGLERIARLQDYAEQRDVPATGQTSQMSAHLRFGTCSARQMYLVVKEGLGADHPLIRQLYWRDFYVQIATHFPHVFGHAFRRHFDAIPWRQNDSDFEKWCAGETGFPIVDAGMRELSATGFMHNRVRMVVASFLTKNLQIDWRRGEAWFADQLIDYDPAVNNGNWQWGASTGCDAQPYFRVFNPWRQQKRFDKDCVYIKRWVPELDAYPEKAIHKLETEGDFYRPKIVDLRESAESIKAHFKSVSARHQAG